MKSIINGKKYDTNTANLLLEWDNGLRTDFRYCSECLYKKNNGEFFIAGEGGPLSKYAESCDGGGCTEGADIVPITENAARTWAEKHASADEYEEIFGEVAE